MSGNIKRIIMHWTAGYGFPTTLETTHYHFLIDALGRVHKGKYAPDDNINCQDGFYAEHTGGGNTGSIGVALCGMANFKSKNNVGDCPLTKIQVESMCKLCAMLAKEYAIEIIPEQVMTHYEFGIKNPKTTSHGKIDIIFLPPFSHVLKDDIGSFLRSKIKWYLKNA
jgi:N-acetyl-anhydromuramyl-L-alanine amidase AmpD